METPVKVGGGHLKSLPWRKRPTPFGWVLLAAGGLYTPTLWHLWHGLWQTPAHGHAPVAALVWMWLMAQSIRSLPPHVRPDPGLGAAVLGVGLLVHVLGRWQSMPLLQMVSLPSVVAGLMLSMKGRKALRHVALPLAFSLFLVPLPGSLIDALTHPLKLAVSAAAESVLHAAGLPVARAGVMLHLGPYQLLVADACSGLNSFFMLEATGLLYLNLVRHPAWLRNMGLLFLILPISFAANVVRVLILALVTYFVGDEAAQGFLHGFSGMSLFLCAIGLMVAADALLRRLPVGRVAS